jgi:hypothetical protein
VRLIRRGIDPRTWRSLAAGVVASFFSTLGSQRLIKLVERDRALWPYAAYRAALAVLVLLRLRSRPRAAPPQPYAPAAAPDAAPDPVESTR